MKTNFWKFAAAFVVGMSALVAGLTVGGKAIGKGIAIGSATKIVQTVGKIIYILRYGPDWFRKRKNNR